MFKVENADFIAEKLEAELAKFQEYREVWRNAFEAIVRRCLSSAAALNGRIEFDVDWMLLGDRDQWFISCADNGDGMSRDELEKYTTTLAVIGANDAQSLTGNQGMGLKISGPTRNRAGVLIRSLKDGEGSAVCVGWTGSEYDLIPIGRSDEKIISVPLERFPDFIQEQGSGTVVTFMGMTDDANTFRPGSQRGWLFKYLNQRLMSASDDGVDVLVRVPSGDEVDWPRSREEADARQRGDVEGPSFNLTRVKGTGSVWTEAANKQGEGFHGIVELPGVESERIPPARVHWWVMPDAGADPSSRTNGPGSMAVLFQGELHDWRAGGHANPLFARMGVLFGKNRIGFIIEPLGSTVTSDFARAHVLVDGTPVFESEAWNVWPDQFRERMPEKVLAAMAEERSRIKEEDPDRLKRIQERLKSVMSLLRPRRVRSATNGEDTGAGPKVTGGGGNGPETVIREPGPSRETRPPRQKRTRRGIGEVLQAADDDGEPGSEIFQFAGLEPAWVTEKEASRFSLVSEDSEGLHDRAAALAGESATTAEILLINSDFRGYRAIVAAANEFGNPEGDDEKAQLIEAEAQEWVEQKLIEAVMAMRQLENGSSWTAGNFDEALSPSSLTAAFMADRYHTLEKVKRFAGKLKAPKAAA